MKKVILITGSSTGFGALMVRTLAREGHTVIATMRHVKDKNARFAETLSMLPHTEVVDLDVTDDDSVKEAVSAVHARHGKIDVLINNAGIYGGGILEGYTLSQAQKIFDVNVWGPFRMNNAILPIMRAAREGLIITISSQVGRISLPLQAAYNASKFALEGLIEGSYAELMGQGVESILIEPGGFMTDIINKVHMNSDREDILKSYGSKVTDLQMHIREAFTRIFTEAAPDPQIVADAALRLIDTEKGKRPFRTPLDPNSKGVDIEYNNATEEIKKRWIAAYGLVEI